LTAKIQAHRDGRQSGGEMLLVRVPVARLAVIFAATSRGDNVIAAAGQTGHDKRDQPRREAFCGRHMISAKTVAIRAVGALLS
jgi:hypothetical protein